MPKSSQTSLTRFLAESGADTRERNRLLRRGSLTHVSDFTAQSPCCLTHSANGKQGFADSLRRASGAPLEEAWGENFIFTPYNPHQTTVKQWFGFLAGAESFQPFLGPYRHYQQQLADIPIFTPCEKIHSSDIETCPARCLLTAVAVSLSLSSTKLITDN